ncbi:zinc finger C2H2-type/integrase DNA-binding domain-containing protein [Artemisia annua]|uniref:Zinc finger C2H2-type/integrase DNA-binding domain-containing protein n=1 Tax=Artemisia annua TaxID=35608 RepID=A0A2U1PUL7_ARTAN|nr:zinc finger C2H2-type/integrase DNA-binding domain-containing protein [Artemisia annua]
MGKNLSDLLSSTCEEANLSDQHSAQTCVEKKLKLFGFELYPLPEENILKANILSSGEGDESINSSLTTMEKNNLPIEMKKFECQYCFKEDPCNFTLTHVDSSREKYMPIAMKPSSRPVDIKQNYTALDLQLSLCSNSIM